MGANAVLLICALLDTETIIRYLKICEELKIDALAALVKKYSASVVWRVLGSRRLGMAKAESKEPQFAAFMNVYKDVKWNGDYAKDNSDAVKNAFNDARNGLKN